jgi:hypothetical protein
MIYTIIGIIGYLIILSVVFYPMYLGVKKEIEMKKDE